VLALDVASDVRRWRHVGPLVDLNPKHAVRVGVSRPWNATVKSDQRISSSPAPGWPFGHLSHDADRREHMMTPRHQQHAAVSAKGERDGERHAGEDDHVVQRDESQVCHMRTLRVLVDDVKYYSSQVKWSHERPPTKRRRLAHAGAVLLRAAR